jgi:hypothetical protein
MVYDKVKQVVTRYLIYDNDNKYSDGQVLIERQTPQQYNVWRQKLTGSRKDKQVIHKNVDVVVGGDSKFWRANLFES